MNRADSIVFFDGVCNLCNGAVQFILKRDKKEIFKFSALQSNFANNTLPSEEVNSLSSIILMHHGKLLRESDAVIAIAGELGYPWKILKITVIIPKFIRDKVYQLIAKNRYKMFGKQDQCMIPTPELINRFID